MDIKRIAHLVGILLLVTAAPAFAWRCEHGFVDTGDSTQTVLRKCGAPAFVYGSTGKSAHARSPALWYYDFGPTQLVRVLKFQGGVLASIDTAGYGLHASTQACTPADVRTGMQVYELVTRCGKPRVRRSLGTRAPKGASAHVETWTYDFGAQYLLQKVTIADGQVRSVETASRVQRR